MLNKYPLWKYLLLIAVVVFGLVYAAPNLYGEDPAVQISHTKGEPVGDDIKAKVEAILADKGITAKSYEQSEKRSLLRLNSLDDQQLAQEAIKESLGRDYVVALNLASATPDFFSGFGATPMKLGLDLRGGVHFLMEVDMEEALKKREEQYISEFKMMFIEKRLRYGSPRRLPENGIQFRFSNREYFDEAISLVEKEYPELTISTVEETDTFYLQAKMSEQKIKETYDYAVQQNIAVLRNRINELGVAEPLIQRHGKDRIVVELPGVQDTAEAKKILGRTATLEFHLENAEYSAFEYIDKAPPRGTKFFETNNGRPILLNEEVILSGQSITDAGFGFDEDGYPQVNISIDTVGARRFSDVTGDNIGEPMATVFIEYKTKTVIENGVEKEVRYRDEKVINVATIRAKLGNRFRITGLDSPNEARELALLLRAGALIAPIYIVEERTVGPAMGQKNIDMGVQAIVLGLSLVVIFMIAYYRVFGLVANVALFLNLVLIVAFMSSIGAVLTLPGIAGIVLTVGMAVDANVLIFQRIREELAEGLSPQKAIHEGYDRAFSTIADANITTLVASVILFAVGTGPIKGFAITLSIGILTSMFTAIFGTRAIVNLIYGGKPVKKLPIGGKA